MRIANNLMAMNAYRQLTINQGGAAKSIEKLSSGLRINRASDDAAGLAISEKMRGQIRGLNQAIRNAQDGISLIQTAEGALTETHAILQRMRELAVQAANDTNTGVDRAEIQKEIDQLAAELTRIAETTEFNTKNLLDGTFTGTFHIGANEGQNITLSINPMDAKSLKVDGVLSQSVALSDGTGTIGLDGVSVRSRTLESITIELVSSGEANNPEVTKTTAVFDADNGKITVTLAQAEGDSNGAGAITATHSQVLAALRSVAGDAGLVIEVDEDTFKGSELVTGTLGEAITQEIQGLVADPDASTVGINVSSQAAADAAITIINNAIETVSAERSKLGAYQNRLEHTIANLGASAENLQAAESRIRDVDMAAEMMQFTKYQILQQASTAMLAQANLAPQSVLQLLG